MDTSIDIHLKSIGGGAIRLGEADLSLFFWKNLQRRDKKTE